MKAFARKYGQVLAMLEFVVFASLARSSSCAPIRTPDFSSCQPATYFSFHSGDKSTTVSCCPPLPKTAPVDFRRPCAHHSATTSQCATTRVRPAAQCADSSYGAKLKRAYELMRALPDDDPRSLVQQANLHCAYCGGSFLQQPPKRSSSTAPARIDIHYTWLFFPWHRLFLFFHERILQTLLNDTSFSLPFWNWDNQAARVDGGGNSCQHAGNRFPHLYSDPRSSTFDDHRNTQHTSGAVIDLAYTPSRSNASRPLTTTTCPNDSLRLSNLNVMRQAMVNAGRSAETFLGAPYRAGDPRPRLSSTAVDEEAGGSVEMGPHVSAHFWVAEDAPPYLDFAAPWISAFDPVFYAHHANVDRLWSAWTALPGRRDFDDRDWLDAQFLFYDERAQLVRARVADALSLEKLGYSYQRVHNSWSHFSSPCKCGGAVEDLLRQLSAIPQPNVGGRVTLTIGGTYRQIVRRPKPRGRSSAREPREEEEILGIHGIRFDTRNVVHFDVFLNFPDADVHAHFNCAEYLGRFNYVPAVPLSTGRDGRQQRYFAWKVSIGATLKELRMDHMQSVLVTVIPRSPPSPTISFRAMVIERIQR